MGSTERIRKLHPKKKGNLGELKVASDLAHKGYPVFTELGDISRVDLLVEVDPGQFLKVQVKCYRSTRGCVRLNSRKSGPGYRFRYTMDDVDLFAVYVYDRDQLLYIPARVVCGDRSHATFRFDPVENGQEASIRFASEYYSFEDAVGVVDSQPL